MNRLQTKIESLANITRCQKSLGFTLLSTLLLSLFSTSAFANRPAMDDRDTDSNEVIEKVTEPQPETSSEMRPTAPAETPSAMDLMMQNHQPQQPQQSQQQITGDVVQLPARELQAGETLQIQLLDYPRRGMNMDKVQHEYGQPITISDSVGKPPITSWTYNDRVVYFEYSTVLHVVAR